MVSSRPTMSGRSSSLRCSRCSRWCRYTDRPATPWPPVPPPFVALGLADLRPIYLVEIVGLVLVLVRQARVPWRPLVAAAVVGNAVIWRQNVVAGVDPLWAVLTIFAFVFLRRRWASPIL